MHTLQDDGQFNSVQNFQYECISDYFVRIQDMDSYDNPHDYLSHFLSELSSCINCYEEYFMPASYIIDKDKFLLRSKEYIVYLFTDYFYNNFNFSGYCLDDFFRFSFLPHLISFIELEDLNFDHILVEFFRFHDGDFSF